jgi:hypothetical protein
MEVTGSIATAAMWSCSRQMEKALTAPKRILPMHCTCAETKQQDMYTAVEYRIELPTAVPQTPLSLLKEGRGEGIKINKTACVLTPSSWSYPQGRRDFFAARENDISHGVSIYVCTCQQ